MRLNHAKHSTCQLCTMPAHHFITVPVMCLHTNVSLANEMLGRVYCCFCVFSFQRDGGKNSATHERRRHTISLNKDYIKDTEGYSDLPAHSVRDLAVFLC